MRVIIPLVYCPSCHGPMWWVTIAGPIECKNYHCEMYEKVFEAPTIELKEIPED